MPQSAKPYYDLALSYQRSGDIAAERTALQTAEGFDPAMADVQNQLGFLGMEDGQLQAAETHFLRALASNPEHLAALANLGVLYARTGRLEQAESLLRLAADQATSQPDAERNLALVLAARGKYGEAVETLHHALKLAPESGEIWLALGTVQEQGGAKRWRHFNMQSSMRPHL
jgi:Flp pilus assembly protein TadD